jgi:hypothetical protein
MKGLPITYHTVTFKVIEENSSVEIKLYVKFMDKDRIIPKGVNYVKLDLDLGCYEVFMNIKSQYEQSVRKTYRDYKWAKPNRFYEDIGVLSIGSVTPSKFSKTYVLRVNLSITDTFYYQYNMEETFKGCREYNEIPRFKRDLVNMTAIAFIGEVLNKIKNN